MKIEFGLNHVMRLLNNRHQPMPDIPLPQVFNPEKNNIKNHQATSLSNMFDPIANPLWTPLAAQGNRSQTRNTTMQM